MLKCNNPCIYFLPFKTTHRESRSLNHGKQSHLYPQLTGANHLSSSRCCPHSYFMLGNSAWSFILPSVLEQVKEPSERSVSQFCNGLTLCPWLQSSWTNTDLPCSTAMFMLVFSSPVAKTTFYNFSFIACM